VPIRVLAKVEGYENGWLTPTLEGDVLSVKLRRAHPVTVQPIRLTPAPTGKNVKISVDGQLVETSFDAVGWAKFSANGRPGDRVLVEVFVDGNPVDSNYRVLGGEIEIQWKTQSKRRE
jgi:hypothetical protein